MSLQDLRAAFDPVLEPAARAATAPMIALAAGVLLFLVSDVVQRLRRFRPVVLVASIAAAFAFEVRILLMEPPPGAVLGGSLVADHGTALWGCLFLAATLLAWAYSIGYYGEEDRPFVPEHDALLLTAPVGMMLMVGAGDLVVFFVGLELLSIPLYALAAFRRARATSVEAGLKYFVLGTFAMAFLVYGASLLYAATGTVSIQELARADLSSPLALAGAAFVGASIFFKISVFPFHLWVPDVYQGAPTPVTALMATGTKAAAIGFLVHASGILPVGAALTVAVLALVTMVLGNAAALVQEDLKRMLAYSSVAHAGTLLLLVAAALSLRGQGDPEAIATARDAALVYMAAYVFTAAGAFGVLALLEADGERFTRLDSLAGLARSRPGASAAIALFMLSLGGIPATGGFFAKWFVFAALLRADMVVVAVVGILVSVVALGYYLRVIVTLYMRPAGEARPPVITRPFTAGLATVVCSAVVLLLGIVPGWFLDRLG